MPRGDRTGPTGKGPMTGRAAGFCAGYGIPGFGSSAPGRGIGMGIRGRRGGGRQGRFEYGRASVPNRVGFGYPASDADAEKQMLMDQVAALQSQLDIVQKRLKDIETGVAVQ